MAEETILTQTEPKVTVLVSPQGGLGTRFVRAFTRGSLPYRRIFEKPFVAALQKGGVEPGDIQDLMDRFSKLQEVTITTKSIVMLYRKGLVSKKDKMMVLPLEYVKSFRESGMRRGLGGLFIKFMVPSEEKPVEFDVILGDLKDRDIWVRELSRIASPLGA